MFDNNEKTLDTTVETTVDSYRGKFIRQMSNINIRKGPEKNQTRGCGKGVRKGPEKNQTRGCGKGVLKSTYVMGSPQKEKKMPRNIIINLK